jgi:hypothetical protein
VLDPEADKPGSVPGVHSGPAVLAVADVAGDAMTAVGFDDPGDEPVVAGAVDGRREPHADRPHAALGELEHGTLGGDARAHLIVGVVSLGGDPVRL